MEKHDRRTTYVRVRESTLSEYRYAVGREKTRLHIEIFYGQALHAVGPATDTTFDMLHPLLVGRIPEGAAKGEPHHGNRADAPRTKQ